MPQDYDNTNRFILFQNDRKERDSQPDWKGTINIKGVDYWFSAWDKDTRSGRAISGVIGDRKEADDDRPRRSRDDDDRPRRARDDDDDRPRRARDDDDRPARRASRDDPPPRRSRDDDDRPARRASRDEAPFDDDVPF